MKKSLLVLGLVTLSPQAEVNESIRFVGKKIFKGQAFVSFLYPMDRNDGDSKKCPFYNVSFYNKNELSKGAVWAPLEDCYYPSLKKYAVELTETNQLSKHDVDEEEDQKLKTNVIA